MDRGSENEIYDVVVILSKWKRAEKMIWDERDGGGSSFTHRNNISPCHEFASHTVRM